MNENDLELQKQLRELGRRPIDVSTMEAHRRRIEAAGVIAVRPRRHFGAVAVAAAGLVGFMVGSAGLAMADALPDPAQAVAHDVLGVVQVDVPAGKEGKRGPCVAEAAKLDDKDAKQAAKDACPKGGDESPEPGTDVGPKGKSDQAPGHTKHEGDPCHGRPPWAGKMSKEEREAAKQAASREACPPDSDDADETGDKADDDADDLTTSNAGADSDNADSSGDQSEPSTTAAATSTTSPTTTLAPTTSAAATTTTTAP